MAGHRLAFAQGMEGYVKFANQGSPYPRRTS